MLAQLAEHIADLSGWRRILVAMVLGAAAALAFAPLHIVPVLLVSFTGLVWLVDSARGRMSAFLIGWWFGLGHFVAGLYWVGKSFAVAGVAEWAAPIAVVLLAAACALFPALATLTLRLLPSGGLPRLVWFASAWTVAEWLRGFLILGGFPWNLVGYVWMPSGAMIQFASLFGVYGLTWVTVLAASAPAAMTDGKVAWRGVAVSWMVLPVIALGGAIRLGNAEFSDVPDVRLRLVQANIAQFHKWRDDLREKNLQTHLTMSAAPPTVEADPPPTHIIWPETAVPYLLATEPAIRNRIAQVVPNGGAVMTGAVRAEPRDDGATEVWNSFHAVDADGAVIATYDKFHLVPFGEYTPLRSILKIAKLTEGTTDFSSGPGPQSISIAGLPLVSPLICYEAIFPGYVVQADVRPGWLLNVTNDAWYGISSGPYQHFQQARLRAVEEGLPIVRVANTGISGVVDPYGRVRQALGLGESGIVDVNLPQPIPDPTVYGRWRDWPIMVVLFLSLAWAGSRASAKKRS